MAVDPEVAALLDKVRAVDWMAWSIRLPNRLFAYEPDTVVPAFEGLAQARDAEQARRAYHAMLDAMGHNHSGTPYAVMSVATPLLARLVPLLEHGAAAGMEALTDCALWSIGEPAFIGPDNQLHDLGFDTREALQTLEPVARRWETSEPENGHRSRAAKELLQALDELT